MCMQRWAAGRLGRTPTQQHRDLHVKFAGHLAIVALKVLIRHLVQPLQPYPGLWYVTWLAPVLTAGMAPTRAKS